MNHVLIYVLCAAAAIQCFVIAFMCWCHETELERLYRETADHINLLDALSDDNRDKCSQGCSIRTSDEETH